MRVRDKTVAALLAAFGGTFGLHRFYLEGPARIRPWLYPAFAWTLIPSVAGLVEALTFALTPDDRWDARWNPDQIGATRSGWLAIVVAVLAFFAAMLLLLTAIAFAIGRWSGADESFFR